MNYQEAVTDIFKSDRHVKFGWKWKVLFLEIFLFSTLIGMSYTFSIISHDITALSIDKKNAPIAFPIIIGVAIYIFKIIVSGLITLRNRSHSLKGLEAYLALTVQYLQPDPNPKKHTD